MKKQIGTTEMVFILDRSGSMAGLETDTIGGFNSLIDKQKKLEGEANVTTVLFDDRYELLHDRRPLKLVQPLTGEDYFVRGSTALLDAVGAAVHALDERIDLTSKHRRPTNVLFVIITDGQENASQRYTATEIKRLISCRQERDGWEFLFLGANIDAVETAEHYGIKRTRAANYHADSQGTAVNFKAVERAMHSMRTNCFLADDWKEEIEADFEDRS